MSSNLVDIFPFLYNVIKQGCHDNNCHVRESSLLALAKLIEATRDFELDDYKDDIVEIIKK